MKNKYADNDGYKRVEAYVALIVDADPPDAAWAAKMLSNERKLGKLLERMLGFIRDDDYPSTSVRD